MALIESISIPLGSSMPNFALKAPDGKEHSNKSLMNLNGLLIAFTCNHCPYAIAVWPRLIELSCYAKTLDINTAAINSNINPNYPEDSPSEMKVKIDEWGIPFPYLIDEDQSVAKSFKAQCTPDIYLFNKENKLVYHGRIDDNWQQESKVKKHELKDALTQLANNEQISSYQKPSLGCSIKWV